MRLPKIRRLTSYLAQNMPFEVPTVSSTQNCAFNPKSKVHVPFKNYCLKNTIAETVFIGQNGHWACHFAQNLEKLSVVKQKSTIGVLFSLKCAAVAI